MTATRQHAEWLSLVEVSGPFLTLPVLQRALPHGLEPTAIELVGELRLALAEMDDDPTLSPRFVRWVLGRLLDLDGEVLVDGPGLAHLSHRVPEHGVDLRPDLAVVEPDGEGPGRPRLLVSEWPAGTALDQRPEGAAWAASPADRMAELCRATGVRLGLVTNGEAWTLVDAPLGAGTGTATWDAALWLEERLTLDAFTTLLGARRFFSMADEDTLEALLAQSADAEAEVTDQLGRQVRAAVELLVDALSRSNRERGGAVFAGLTTTQVYEAAVSVLMRLVFLLSAEERGLFLLGDPTYDTTYAVSTLRAQLEEEARAYGEDVLERHTDAWHRLLATFRMVHSGAGHEDLRLPAYGGSLFDPDRFGFLEGRSPGQPWDEAPSAPLPVDNRTILHLLDALQVLRFRGRGGVMEARRLSFRSLDVEQIGHVYEGLLDHSVVPVDEVALGLEGRREPELALEEIEGHAGRGREHLVAWLAEQAGLSPKAVEKRLSAEADPDDHARLVSACDNDHALAERVSPYLGLVRRDLRGLPQVFVPGSYVVTQSLDRRTSGTYYTPRALAEEMVTHTLEPLVYAPGPAEGADPEQWRLRPGAELLDLRVCDMAMGSGAFLVAACRYMADRLLEAWTAEGIGPGDSLPLPGGQALVMPGEEADRQVMARRLVADRCLYGVDRNPMAVEMAKLSLWLVTLAKDQPFSFLDHALRCGDSLLGITDLAQLECLHLDPAAGRQLHGGRVFDPAVMVTPLVKEAVEKRRQLEAFPVLDVRDAERKQRLLDEANELLDRLKVVGDVVVGAALSTSTHAGDAYDDRLLTAAPEVQAALDPDLSEDDRDVRLSDLRLTAEYWLDEGRPPMTPARRCLHWPLEFPEVFLDRPAGRFDAVFGNPPFAGGQRITGAFGTAFREYLVRHVAGGARGSADLVAYFFLRASQAANRIGLLATNTISQGNTREVGLDQLLAHGWKVTAAWKSSPWLGQASLEVAKLWLQRGQWAGAIHIDEQPVSRITSTLEPGSRVNDVAHKLQANAGRSYQGSIVLGLGFLLSPEQAKALIDKDPRNADVLFPYLNGEDLNSRPDQSASRWVINFFDWPLDRAEQYPDCLEILQRLVKPDRDKVKRAARRKRWWQYAERAAGLYTAIDRMERVLAIARISKTIQPTFVRTGLVFNEKTVVLAYDDDEHFGLLSSMIHRWWALMHSSTLRADTQYTPSDCFETFPQPELPGEVGSLGGELESHRRALMLARWEGLTKTYNRVHNPDEHAQDIAELRRLHTDLDHAVAAAYGWNDLNLDHDFHETRQGVRYTIGLAARTEVLDRLLELNHERYADEVRRGLHAKAAKKKGGRSTARPPRRNASDSAVLDFTSTDTI